MSAVSKPSAIGGTWEAGSDESMQRLLVVITVTTPTLLPPGYPLKWRLKNDRRNYLLITGGYPDLGGASDLLKQISLSAQPRAIPSQTEFSDLLQLFILFWPFLTLMSPWQNDVVFQVFSRHQSQDGTRWPQHEVMLQLNAEVDRLQQQYHVRIIGENGVAKGIIDLVNPIETW